MLVYQVGMQNNALPPPSFPAHRRRIPLRPVVGLCANIERVSERGNTHATSQGPLAPRHPSPESPPRAVAISCVSVSHLHDSPPSLTPRASFNDEEDVDDDNDRGAFAIC